MGNRQWAMGNKQWAIGNRQWAINTNCVGKKRIGFEEILIYLVNIQSRFGHMAARNFKETKVYKLAFEQAMEIFETTKEFPKDEVYSLTGQIRRSSRSVCANIAEAYRRKLYPSYFVSKASDSDTENSETNVWIDFSSACNYISLEKFKIWIERNEEIGRLLNHMIKNPDKY